MAKVALIGIDAAIPTLVQKYFKDGKLPNMRKLAEDGIWSECIPVFPTHTASNWNSVATGAWPKTHGVTDMVVHLPGTPLTEIKSGFYSDLCQAEQIWLTAEKFNKKSILLKYIASWPPNMKNGIQVEGFGAPGGPGSRPWGSSPLSISNSSCFATMSLENSTLVRFTETNLSDWKFVTQKSYQLSPLEAEIKIGPLGGITFHVLILSDKNNEYDTAIFTKDKNIQTGFSLKKNQLSKWLIDHFDINQKLIKGAFRLKLIEIGGVENIRFKLFVSQVFPIEGWTHPPAVAKELVDRFGPFLESISHFPYVFGWSDEDTYLDDADYQAKWLGNAAGYLMSKYEWDLFMMQWHGIDNTQHAFLRFDKSVLSGNESEVSDKVVLRTYEIADELVGDITRGIKENNKHGDDSYTIVLSDHGHVMGKRRFFINSHLYKNGLIKLKKDSVTGKLTIDWKNTQAYSQGMVSVYVNLIGRDPEGSVKPGVEYEETVEKIIDLLYGIKDPKTMMRPISLALSNKHAEFMGMTGERVGDVVFAANPIYAVDNRITAGDLFVDLKTGLPDGSIHGAQLPSVDLGKYGTIKSMFIAQGPKLKKHYVREKPINIIDVAPTMAYLLDIPAPKNSEGAIMYDLLE